MKTVRASANGTASGQSMPTRTAPTYAGASASRHSTTARRWARGLDDASGTISIEQDCSIDLTSGLTDYGTGSRTVFTLIAAEELA